MPGLILQHLLVGLIGDSQQVTLNSGLQNVQVPSPKRQMSQMGDPGPGQI